MIRGHKWTQNTLKCEYGAIRERKRRINNKCYIASAKATKKDGSHHLLSYAVTFRFALIARQT